MCGGGPEVDTTYQDHSINEAERNRAEQQARQARVDEGLRQIRAIFDGGSYAAPKGASKAVKVNGSWKVKNPTSRRKSQRYEGVNPILQQREQAMRDFYLPQLDKKAEDARENLTFALARAGLLNSSSAGERQGDLNEELALERGGILSKIAADQSATRSRVNQQRSAIESGLRSSGDASAAASQALASAVSFREDMPDLSPIGHLFTGIAEGIGSYVNGYRAGEIKRAATPNPLGSGSGKVVA